LEHATPPSTSSCKFPFTSNPYIGLNTFGLAADAATACPTIIVSVLEPSLGFQEFYLFTSLYL
jgi:hypothetical protein